MEKLTEEAREEKSEQKGGVTIRTRVIDINRDQNNFIGELARLSSVLEKRIKELIVDTGEAEEGDIHASAILTLDAPPNVRDFATDLSAFKYMRLRAAISTKRASSTITCQQGKYQHDCTGEITQTLITSTSPFKDVKYVMEARLDNGVVLLEFKPISRFITENNIVVKLDYPGWEEVIEFLATTISGHFIKQMQVYDLICVFRNIAFESTADAIAG